MTDLCDRRSVLVGDDEIRLDVQRSLDKEFDRGVLGKGRGGRQVPQVGHRQGRYDELLLAAEVEWRPAGDQHLQPGRRGQQVSDEGRRVQDLLEVVEQQQELFLAQELLQVLQQWSTSGFANSKCLGD